jgi:DNA-binding response OmpR family regulator
MNAHFHSHSNPTAVQPRRDQTNPSPRILVVDDDSEIRHLSTHLLLQSGYQVDAAEDGAAAWEALHAKNYDLLITDHNMPKVSGVELVKKVRSARMTLPVILASGVLPEAELERHPWLQLASTLSKPFSPDQLLQMVKEVLHSTDSAREPIAPPPNWPCRPSADGLQL